MDVNLSKLRETEDREAWHAAVHGFAISLDKTEQRNNWQWPEFYHCFGHLMQKADSLGKTVMLGKIEGKRREG